MPLEVVATGPAPLDPRAEQTMVAMRDRVRLATDVYLPERPGRLPSVLVRMPYDKSARDCFLPRLSPYVNDRGYALVVQDVRGKFRSEGETMPFAHDIADAYDTLEWITGQPWSDGSVGMWGDSYCGWTQWAAVACRHPALKAIVPRVTSTDFMDSGHWWGDWVMPLYLAQYLARYWLDRHAYQFPVDWTHRPLAEVFDEGFAAIGARSAAFDQFMLHRGRGGFPAYPASRCLFASQRVPALHTVGWFDCIGAHSMRDYMALRALPERSRLQYLLADSADHDNHRLRSVPPSPGDDRHVGDAALARTGRRLIGPGLDFFDAFVARRADPEVVARVRWHLAYGRWRESDVWPPRRVHDVRLHLSAARRAADGPAGGRLAWSPDSRTGYARWIHDPGHLVPSAVSDPFSMLMEWPDERAIESRGDVLTFTSEPLHRRLDLVGPVSAVLDLASSAGSMHVHVKLLDVGPDGAARLLVRGQTHVGGCDQGRPTRIDLGHTGYGVRAGHSLRLHVASSDFPLFLWHPGTGENPWFAGKGMANQQTLATGGSRGSYVSLSVQ